MEERVEGVWGWEATGDEEWNVVEAKAEEKLKARLREWAQEDGPRMPREDFTQRSH